ncbi:hypothetical protein GCM10010206_09820 [Streptomyces cinerochromogenes]|nr:hypothetical protein GCM10010206_09820 [Streptomyces cinerochromogenes]
MDEPATGDVHQIEAVGHQVPRQLDRLLRGPAAVGPVRGREAYEERAVFRPLRPYGVGDRDQETVAPVEIASVLVAAVVGQR